MVVACNTGTVIVPVAVGLLTGKHRLLVSEVTLAMAVDKAPLVTRLLEFSVTAVSTEGRFARSL